MRNVPYEQSAILGNAQAPSAEHPGGICGTHGIRATLAVAVRTCVVGLGHSLPPRPEIDVDCPSLVCWEESYD